MSAIAQLATYPTSVTNGIPFRVTLAVINNGASPVSIAGLVPIINAQGQSGGNVAAAKANPNIGPGSPTTIAAGGASTVLTWTDVIHAPTGGWGLSQGSAVTYSYGAQINFADGSTVAAQAGLVTVVPLPTGQPSTKPQGGVGPSTPTATSAPSASSSGAFQLDYTPNAVIGAVLT